MTKKIPLDDDPVYCHKAKIEKLLKKHVKDPKELAKILKKVNYLIDGALEWGEKAHRKEEIEFTGVERKNYPDGVAGDIAWDIYKTHFQIDYDKTCLKERIKDLMNKF